MSTFKKTKVVMLPTNEKATMALSGNKLSLKTKALQEESQHLYFLSDEEIKEGDWVYNEISKEIYQFKENRVDYEKKIIATTDKSLKVFIHTTMAIDMDDCYESLPQPSQSFIEKFVEEYNKGNQITEVMVEYDRLTSFWEREKDGLIVFTEKKMEEVGGVFTFYEGNKLKINPKDNTITIRKVKDSWSREEVKQLFDKMYALTDFVDINVIKVDFDKWIEENL